MRLLYQCESCEGSYRVLKLAQQCEAYEMPEPPVPVGKFVTIITANEGDVKAKVVRWILDQAYEAALLGDLDAELWKIRKRSGSAIQFHQWLCVTERAYEIRSENWTSTIPPWAIREMGGKGYWETDGV